MVFRIKDPVQRMAAEAWREAALAAGARLRRGDGVMR